MKIKLLIIFFLSIISSIFIYLFKYSNDFMYLAIGDELSLGINPFNKYGKSYVDYFSLYLENKNNNFSSSTIFIKQNLTINDILAMMDNKEKISYKNKNLNINQFILKSDVITLSFYQDELYNLLKINYKDGNIYNVRSINTYINDIYQDYIELISKIRKISNVKIYIVGYYNVLYNVNNNALKDVNKIIENINNKFMDLETIKNVYYINIYPYINEKSYYIPNDKMPYPSLEGYNFISNEIINKYKIS